MKKRLLLLGAGDFSKEVIWMISEIPAESRNWELGGLLDPLPDESAERLRRYGFNLPVLGAPADYQPAAGDCFVCALGSPKAKLEFAGMMKERGAEFTNVVHPSVAIAPGAIMGSGGVFGRGVVVSVNTRIGDFVTINNYSSVGHDAVIEEGCTLSSYCDVTGHAHLERGVFLGSHAAVLPKARVGQYATVGAGSVVVKRVEPGATVIGVPAKALLHRA